MFNKFFSSKLFQSLNLIFFTFVCIFYILAHAYYFTHDYSNILNPSYGFNEQVLFIALLYISINIAFFVRRIMKGDQFFKAKSGAAVASLFFIVVFAISVIFTIYKVMPFDTYSFNCSNEKYYIANISKARKRIQVFKSKGMLLQEVGTVSGDLIYENSSPIENVKRNPTSLKINNEYSGQNIDGLVECMKKL